MWMATEVYANATVPSEIPQVCTAQSRRMGSQTVEIAFYDLDQTR